ncbi:DnaJ C-terminal domain-containing protein [Crenobacter sp. SG2305]|uniref:DnaJ C-terminal domain-containing protein n=1 Tax=Crenobacter oryzisoli TaxID=3056844 RepID=UPI0025AA3486|nr:DnaJ C-terminal domain-containing protein [Crenobacter sp. SG2305]MDN0084847.1 DnaJ C-terminal domain-containing protein [Crenobacter sp. SG2305]
MDAVKRDYYEVLGVPRTADQKQIRDTFRKLALQFHPDRNKAPGAEERFKEVAEAYAVLSDPKKRADYDARGFGGVADFSAEDLFGGIDFGDLLGGGGLGFGGDIFDRFFGRRRAGPKRGNDLRVTVTVPMSVVMYGGEHTVQIPQTVRCDECHGSGARKGTAPRTCPDCKGSGNHVEIRHQGGMSLQTITLCSSCHGRGYFIDQPCPVCTGSGVIERLDSLTVRIPVGVEEGTVLRVAGHGEPGADKKATPGDLLVVVVTEPDSRFQRDGCNLWRTEEVSVTEAVLGGRREVPTLDGTATVTIPAGVQPDTVLRLAGKGLPRFGGGKRGDLLLTIRVRVPDHLSAEERRHYQALHKLANPKG